MHGLVDDLAAQRLTLRDVLEMHLTEADMLDSCTAAAPLDDLAAALRRYMQARATPPPCAQRPCPPVAVTSVL